MSDSPLQNARPSLASRGRSAEGHDALPCDDIFLGCHCIEIAEWCYTYRPALVTCTCMHAAAALRDSSVVPQIRISQSVRIILARIPQTFKAKSRAFLTCMAHPAGGSYSIWAMPKGALGGKSQCLLQRNL